MLHTSTYTVTGMTCAHCESVVATELSELPGVTAVDVNLDTGVVTVSSDAPLQESMVAAAVDEAGYALAEDPT
jgi:copper chaperone